MPIKITGFPTNNPYGVGYQKKIQQDEKFLRQTTMDFFNANIRPHIDALDDSATRFKIQSPTDISAITKRYG